jgi:hypothetical protein
LAAGKLRWDPNIRPAHFLGFWPGGLPLSAIDIITAAPAVPYQSFQKSNRSGASAVYLTIEAIDLVPRAMWLEFGVRDSGNMKVSFQAARSNG